MKVTHTRQPGDLSEKARAINAATTTLLEGISR
jgi:hypothetical protein